MTNLYAKLGISPDATEQDIKRAYRAKALQLHPDRNDSPDASEEFKQVNDAYEVLGDTEQRKMYDAKLNGKSSPFDDGDGVIDINEIFNMMFQGGGFPPHHGIPNVRIFHQGGGGFHGHPFFQQQLQKPIPIIKTVKITMDQCYHGCCIPVEIEKWTTFAGSNIKNVSNETLYVNIPPGIDSNEYIVLRERGNSIDDEMKGDVKIAVEIINDTNFQRVGLDLIYRKAIPLKDALCGFSLEIKHLNGKVLCLSNKSNVIKPNYKKNIPKMGFKRDETTIGNLIIEFDVVFPDKLSEEQIKTLINVL
jgi:DnaJ-class molecular chaperone